MAEIAAADSSHDRALFPRYRQLICDVDRVYRNRYQREVPKRPFRFQRRGYSLEFKGQRLVLFVNGQVSTFLDTVKCRLAAIAGFLGLG